MTEPYKFISILRGPKQSIKSSKTRNKLSATRHHNTKTLLQLPLQKNAICLPYVIIQQSSPYRCPFSVIFKDTFIWPLHVWTHTHCALQTVKKSNDNSLAGTSLRTGKQVGLYSPSRYRVTMRSLSPPCWLDGSPRKQVCSSTMPLHLPLTYRYILHFQTLAIPSAVLVQKLGLLYQHTTWQPGTTAGKTCLLGMWNSPRTSMEICEQKPGPEFFKVMSNKNDSILPEIFLQASLPQELYYSFLGHTVIPREIQVFSYTSPVPHNSV